MLSTLRIQNLATVEDLEIEFGPGLNILTGETGAGKSVILKSMDLLTGKRASSDLIRQGATNCTVEGIFYQKSAKNLEATLNDEINEILQEEEILIKRSIDQGGKSKIYINGRLVTASILQLISPYLLDITGQHQQQTLLDSSEHLQLLDNFGIKQELKDAVAKSFETYTSIKRKIDSLQKSREQQDFYLEKIRAEFEELNKAQLRVGARAEFEQEQSKLANSENITKQLNLCLEIIESDDASLETQIGTLENILSQACKLDPHISEIAQLIESAKVQIEEAKIQLQDYGSSLIAEPDRLEFLRERIAEIARLERKYSKKETELVTYFEKISKELSELDTAGLDINTLKLQLQDAEQLLRKDEVALTKERTKLGTALAKQIKTNLQSLNMKQVEFVVDVKPSTSSALGADQVELLISANPGEPPRALGKVASGGELSRVLLVLKTILNERLAAGTQIFDEVDSGISGAVAQIVGEKLFKVSKKTQVILVTHSPQVAAFADNHFEIFKEFSENRAHTKVKLMNYDEQVKHLAGMLAGKDVSKHFELSAKELLSSKK